MKHKWIESIFMLVVIIGLLSAISNGFMLIRNVDLSGPTESYSGKFFILLSNDRHPKEVFGIATDRGISLASFGCRKIKNSCKEIINQCRAGQFMQ